MGQRLGWGSWSLALLRSQEAERPGWHRRDPVPCTAGVGGGARGRDRDGRRRRWAWLACPLLGWAPAAVPLTRGGGGRPCPSGTGSGALLRCGGAVGSAASTPWGPQRPSLDPFALPTPVHTAVLHGTRFNKQNECRPRGPVRLARRSCAKAPPQRIWAPLPGSGRSVHCPRRPGVCTCCAGF